MSNPIHHARCGKRGSTPGGEKHLAVVAGFLAVVILAIGTDVVLHQLGIFNWVSSRRSGNGWPIAGSRGQPYSGRFVEFSPATSRPLGPNGPMGHAMVDAGIGMLPGTAGAIATWNQDLGPSRF